jgi:hypothetical protein
MYYYDLETLEALSHELNFVCSRISSETSDVLEISLSEQIILEFHNLHAQEDTVMGFKGTSWHSHGKLMLMRDEAAYAELDELDILQGLKAGDLLILEQYLDHTLHDRWLAHKKDKIDVQYIQANEEIRIRRTA